MLRRVAIVRTKVSVERITSHIRVARIGELGTTIAVTSNRRKMGNIVFLRYAGPIAPIFLTLTIEMFL
jgi:hypothetical protein